LNNALSSFFSTHFFFGLFFDVAVCGAVFHNAGNFNGDISAWQVGEVTTMLASTYTLFSPFPRSGLFLGVSEQNFSSLFLNPCSVWRYGLQWQSLRMGRWPSGGYVI
tara:strand:- start:54 stop:374 length:321 start_codon:yes stop_codon:yes gene_type:complete